MPHGGAFEDLKILEFGGGAATPLASRYFAEHGARVVRVESRRRPDFLRVLGLGPSNPHGLDGAPMFILLNADKESVCLDLSKPEGVEVARKLVAWADVVSENFSPGVMGRFGLDYERCRRVNPSLVMVSGCLFGQTGPERAYPGFGGQSSAIAGFNHLTGWPDREAVGPFGTISDSIAARYVGLLIASAVLERRRTGKGRYIDASQFEACVYSLSEVIVRASATGESLSRRGNHDEAAAPHAIYPCAGVDRWIAIAVFSDREWEALRAAMGDPDWARAPALARVEGRLVEQEELDRRIADWTRGQEAVALMERLQAVGVEAGVVATYDDLLADPQLRFRGHFRTLRHAKLGEMHFEHSGILLGEHPRSMRAPGPDLGEHTRAVLEEIAGLSKAEIERLMGAGVLA
jgi:crotonobetainyl-CoA:carnitine CoA-transferase CaiB-like acyl-CoA transferase